MRRTITLLVLLAVLGLAVSASAAIPKLKGAVGPSFTISLKTAAGKQVKVLKRGKYRFVVKDQASIHNFTLDGPGFEDKTITGTGFTGTKTVTLKLKKGKYKYYCTVHPTIIKGTFKVTS